MDDLHRNHAAEPLPRDASRFLRLSPDPVAVLSEPEDGRFRFLSSLEMIAEAEADRRAAVGER